MSAVSRPRRPKKKKKKNGVGAYIQFLINNKDRVLVVGQNRKCWQLSSGRIAKKQPKVFRGCGQTMMTEDYLMSCQG